METARVEQEITTCVFSIAINQSLSESVTNVKNRSLSNDIDYPITTKSMIATAD